MAVKKENKEETLKDISPEIMKVIMEEQSAFADNILNYELPDVLEDCSQPFTMGEKKKYSKKYDVKNIDGVDEIDDFIDELLAERGIPSKEIDDLKYSDLLTWARKVCYGTFHLKKIVAKK